MNGIEKYEKEHSVTIFYRLHLDERKNGTTFLRVHMSEKEKLNRFPFSSLFFVMFAVFFFHIYRCRAI